MIHGRSCGRGGRSLHVSVGRGRLAGGQEGHGAVGRPGRPRQSGKPAGGRSVGAVGASGQAVGRSVGRGGGGGLSVGRPDGWSAKRSVLDVSGCVLGGGGLLNKAPRRGATSPAGVGIVRTSGRRRALMAGMLTRIGASGAELCDWAGRPRIGAAAKFRDGSTESRENMIQERPSPANDPRSPRSGPPRATPCSTSYRARPRQTPRRTRGRSVDRSGRSGLASGRAAGRGGAAGRVGSGRPGRRDRAPPIRLRRVADPSPGSALSWGTIAVIPDWPMPCQPRRSRPTMGPQVGKCQADCGRLCPHFAPQSVNIVPISVEPHSNSDEVGRRIRPQIG